MIPLMLLGAAIALVPVIGMSLAETRRRAVAVSTGSEDALIA